MNGRRNGWSVGLRLNATLQQGWKAGQQKSAGWRRPDVFKARNCERVKRGAESWCCAVEVSRVANVPDWTPATSCLHHGDFPTFPPHLQHHVSVTQHPFSKPPSSPSCVDHKITTRQSQALSHLEDKSTSNHFTSRYPI